MSSLNFYVNFTCGLLFTVAFGVFTLAGAMLAPASGDYGVIGIAALLTGLGCFPAAIFSFQQAERY